MWQMHLTYTHAVYMQLRDLVTASEITLSQHIEKQDQRHIDNTSVLLIQSCFASNLYNRKTLNTHTGVIRLLLRTVWKCTLVD